MKGLEGVFKAQSAGERRSPRSGGTRKNNDINDDQKGAIMKITLISIGSLFFLFILFLLYRMRLGHVVAIHQYRFEKKYEEILSNTGSKQKALRGALPVFRSCPILNRLTLDDYERITTLIKISPDPKKIIEKIVIKMDTKTSLLALRDDDFLSRLAAIKKE